MDYKELFGEELGTQLEQIATEKKINLIVDDKEKPTYIPKSRLDEVIGVRNELKTQVGELTNQLEELKKASNGNEELTTKITELQTKNTEWENKYKSSLLENAIKLQAIQNKAKDPTDLHKFLDASKLEITEDGSIKGLQEQLDTLKESKKYLFDESTKTITGTNPPNNNNVTTEEGKLKDAYNQALKEGNLALAISLKNKLFLKK